MTAWRGLHPLTRGLLLAAAGTGVLNVLLALAGYNTALHHAAAFLIGSAHHDSWEPMRQALAYVRSGAPAPLYEVVFFQRGTIFTYPTASLFFIEAIGLVTGRTLPGDGALNLVSWLAVATTIVATAQVLVESCRVQLPEFGTRSSTERRVVWLLGAVLTLSFYPVVKAFTLGQVQTVVTALVACAMLAFVRGRDVWAGACIGLACLFKPQVGLLVAWALLRRRWTFAGAWLVVVAPLGLWSVARYGLANQFDYVRQLSFITAHSWSYAPNQSVAGILNRALFIGHNLDWDTHYVPYNPWVYAGTLVSSAVLVLTGLAAGLRGSDPRSRDLAPMALATLCFTMASPVAWEHHYGVAVPAFAWLTPMLAADRASARRRAVAAVSFVCTASLLHPLDWFASTPLNVLQNALFAGALLLVVLLFTARTPRAGRAAAPVSNGADAGALDGRQADAAGVALLALLAAANAWFINYIADDAFIVFRYIRNIEAGLGVVFNAGERVEGYSTFLWLALLTALHSVLPMLSLPALARGGGVLAAMGVVVVTARRMPGAGVTRRVLLAAALLVAVDASFGAWAAAGLETPLYALLVTAGVLETARVLDGRPLTWWPGVWFALASLTRPEGPLFLAVALLFLTGTAWQRGRLTLATLMSLVLPTLLLLGPQVLWRHWYYGAWVPNTALAKVPGGLDHLRDGFAYVRNFTRERDTLAWLPLVLVPLLRRRVAWLVYLLATIAVYLAYVMVVGGDSLGFYRFLVPVIPLMAMVAALSLVDTAAWLQEAGVSRPATAGLTLAGVAVLAWLAVAPAVRPPRWHDDQSGLTFPGDGIEHVYRWYGNYFVDRLTIAAAYLNAHTEQGALVASTPAGAIGFYLDRPLLDMLGLSDRHIASTAGVYTGPDARAGHEKGDGRYVLSREPDYILLGNVAVLPEPLDDEAMAGRVVMKSEHEIWADPSFHARYERVTVPLSASGPFRYFTFYRKRGLHGR